jgi:hypothetical protein
MERPEVSALTEGFYEALGWHASKDGDVGQVTPPRTNLSARPNSEAAALLTSAGSFTVSQVLASAEGIDPIIEGHAYLTKSVYAGGADSNVGFFAYNFPAADSYTVSIYCQLGADWDGGGVQFSAEGYAGWAEVDVLKVEASSKGSWRRVVCRITVVSGDLSGNLVLRAAPGFPTVGRAMYFDAKQIETGDEATDYVDGGLSNCEWIGAPNASTSKFLGSDTTWPLLRTAAAWVETLLDPVYEVVRERLGQPGWAILLDPANCPAKALPYLAQYVGAVLTPEMDEAQQRAEIEEPTSWKRGQLPSIKLVGARGLTGTKRVIVRSRTPSVGHHFIRTLASETPSPERTEFTLRKRAVPAWERLDYEAMVGVTWEDVAASFESWAEVKSKFKSWADLADTLPSELPG